MRSTSARTLPHFSLSKKIRRAEDKLLSVSHVAVGEDEEEDLPFEFGKEPKVPRNIDVLVDLVKFLREEWFMCSPDFAKALG